MSDPRLSLQRRQPGFSGWSLAALLCSSVLFCPPLPLLGVLLGLRALVHVRAVPGRRGRGIALVAIGAGIIATIWWITAAVWWDRNARTLMLDGPRDRIMAGQAGDLAVFRGGFVEGAGTDEEAARFLSSLHAEHGRLLATSQGEATGADGAVLDQQGRVTIPYRFHFEQGETPGRATFVTYDGKPWNLVLRFAWVEIDGAGGTLRYPDGELP